MATTNFRFFKVNSRTINTDGFERICITVEVDHIPTDNINPKNMTVGEFLRNIDHDCRWCSDRLLEGKEIDIFNSTIEKLDVSMYGSDFTNIKYVCNIYSIVKREFISARGNGKTWTQTCMDYIANDIKATEELMGELERKKMMNYWYGINGICKPVEPTPEEKQKKHIEKAKQSLYDTQITKVIFNDMVTVVFFKDGKKIVVKCSEMDAYSKEAAIALAYFKWDIGEEYFHYVMNALTGKKGKTPEAKYGRKINIVDNNEDTNPCEH